MAELLKAISLFDAGIQFCLILMLLVVTGVASYTLVRLTEVVLHNVSIWFNGWPPEHAFEEYEDSDDEPAGQPGMYTYTTKTTSPEPQSPQKE